MNINEQLIELQRKLISGTIKMDFFRAECKKLTDQARVQNRKEWISAIELERSGVLTASY